jgi:hypothetical protein
MVPPTFYRIPLFFDFSSPYPVSTVKLGRKQIGYASRLDGTLHVCFPESPRNMDIGMMMFTLEIVSRNDTIFYSRFRPTVLRYKDDLETKMETLTYFFLLLMGWKKRQQCQDLALLEYKETRSNGYDGGGGGFLKRLREDVFLRIWINKGNVEVYHCELWLHTELRGIRYWMKRYKWLFGLVAIGNLWFWLFSSLSLVLFVSLFLWLPH